MDRSAGKKRRRKPTQVTVQRRGAVLHFPTLARPSERLRLERAHLLLEALRTSGPSEHAFGGRLTSAGIDREATLRSYYPCLEQARLLLLGDPELAEEIHAFVEQVSVPDDLRGLCRACVGLPEKKATNPNRPTQLKAIHAEIQRLSLSRLSHKALAHAYRHDLTQVYGLAEADQKLGGVPGALWQPATPDPEAVSIAGLQLQRNQIADKDLLAIPRTQHADLVITATTTRNLRLLASAWRLRQPVLLEGPTSAGKTSAIRYLAWRTASPFRRLNLSYFTDVSDLLGRYVAGERRYTRGQLRRLTLPELRRLAARYDVGGAKKATIIGRLLSAQQKPRWVNGPVIGAMKRGEVLLLDEVNLARPEIIERLNSLFDDDRNLVLSEHHNEVVAPHPAFRIFATMNPVTYAGRERLSEAMRARWNNVFVYGLSQADTKEILIARYGSRVPAEQLAQLVAFHDRFAAAAEAGELGRRYGGLAVTLRNLFRVCERFLRLRGGDLGDHALLRRESEEAYLGTLLDPRERQSAFDLLRAVMPYNGPGFYDDPRLYQWEHAFGIGDLRLRKLKCRHPRVPGDSARLITTRRTRELLYRLGKAIACGENVALVGERAAGKTALVKMFAQLRGQPYFRHNLSGATDSHQLIGGYDESGWRDGLLLDAGRPDAAPGVFLADELNLANPALLERLNSVLDDERRVILAEKEGEEVRLHPEFCFVAAMNPPTPEYGGRRKLSLAMQNRFTQIQVPPIDERDEQMEIMLGLGDRLGLSAPVVSALVDMQQWLQTALADGTLAREKQKRDRPVFSIRQMIRAAETVAETQTELGPGPAFLLAVESQYVAAATAANDRDRIQQRARELAR